MIAMFVVAFADSPELWRVAWISAVVILFVTFLKVMVGDDDDPAGRHSEASTP
jgi:hypothetical protein